jgi:hypothetical protein
MMGSFPALGNGRSRWEIEIGEKGPHYERMIERYNWANWRSLLYIKKEIKVVLLLMQVDMEKDTEQQGKEGMP